LPCCASDIVRRSRLLPSTYPLYVVERLGVRVAAEEDDCGYQTIDAFTTIT
jgi:hypothetical protein